MGNFRNRNGRGDYRSSYQTKRGLNGKQASFANPALTSSSLSRPTWREFRESEQAQDALLGFKTLPPGSSPRVGWLVNMVASVVEEPLTKRPVQAVDFFFIAEEGDDFSATVIARPYLYVGVKEDAMREVEMALRKRFGDEVADIRVVKLEDIGKPNHLALDEGSSFLKLETRTLGDLFSIRKSLEPIVRRNADRRKRRVNVDLGTQKDYGIVVDPLDSIEDIREYDVAPVNRLAIDRKINVGYWYKVTPGGDESHKMQDSIDGTDLDFAQGAGVPAELDPDISEQSANDFASARFEKLPDIVERANPVVLAYDIECTKKPLKFPDAEAGDQVMMISWMVDGQGYLGINREVVSKDIEDFEYKPHAEYHGKFQVFNEKNEIDLLQRFFSETRIAAPRVFVTFNGDYFDWPFVEKRAEILGLNMVDEIGMKGPEEDVNAKETRGRAAIHMDVFHWVNRDSYLPQGSRGLKAVTRALLGFEPEEIPPEEMMAAAIERPDEMAKYSVSDAVCTYYLYMKYVHPFIFSLCNIIPLNPDDVLRKGSGTLCEMLLMCQAKDKRIIAPNKYLGNAIGKLTEDGHVLESETYIGGHVEAIRTGVYRSDLPLQFTIDLNAIDDLESTLDETLKFAITVEGKMSMEDVTNYNEVREEIVRQLEALRKRPNRSEKPLIYHLDVSAMYPNIILTNRLQPHAIVTAAQCAACDFNGMSNCQRDMEWTWRGEFYPASRGEAEMIQRRAAQEERENELRQAEEAREAEQESKRAGSSNQRSFDRTKRGNGRERSWTNRPDNTDGKRTAIASFEDENARKNVTFRKRLKKYCVTNYRKSLETRVVDKVATVCQRENPFYVDTVRAFRDRRYEYKGLLKKQKKSLASVKASGDDEAIKRCKNLIVLYDSLQLAHKCILNSFYGYVMRKGARWYSMEMAGIVTNTGGLIIRRAREFIDKVGLPLELDTDGIWCALPISFPENFVFKTKSGKDYSISYICSVFNSDVAANFTNHQYQDLVDPETFEYQQRSECSIFFEVDGPYKAMVLPASLEEGKNIKKRYAVFNPDGSLAELKGFEIKRRGELKLIKEFQKEIFDRFLQGGSLSECYEHVGQTCNKWLDVLTTRGQGMSDPDLLDLLVEQNNMSKPLDEYLAAGQKSCAITCATRMKEFLGPAITKDKGLATMYVIAKRPEEDQVTTRAIPVKIFDFPNEAARRKLLKRWTKNSDSELLELRSLLDWEYYKGRLANAILKIVSIPAALQAVDNPVPRIEYPPWLLKRCRELKDKRKQRTVTSFFKKMEPGEKRKSDTFRSLRDAASSTDKMDIEDIEDIPIASWTAAKVGRRKARAVVTRRHRGQNNGARFVTSKSGDVVFRSYSTDPAKREAQARSAMLRLYHDSRPDKRRDYAGWVEYAKQIWRAQRSARVHRYAAKRKRVERIVNSDDGGDEAVGGFGGDAFASRLTKKRKTKKFGLPEVPDYAPDNFVADLLDPTGDTRRRNFFTTKSVPLLGTDVIWQNVAISKVDGKPGEYRLWVLPVKKDGSKYTYGDISSIPLRVNRVLYYNSRVANLPELHGVSSEKVNGFTLPRSRDSQFLFRLEMKENVFQESDKDLTSTLTDAALVDGVFGTRAPLDFEVILTLGTMCAPRRSVLSGMTSREVLQKGLVLDDIIPRRPDAAPYLRETKEREADSVLNQAFLYGSHALDGSSRAIYAVIAPAAKLVFIVAVTQADFNVNVKRAWKRLLDERATSAENPEYHATPGVSEREKLPLDTSFSTKSVSTRADAWSAIQKVLTTLRGGRSISNSTKSTGQRTILLAEWPELDVATATEEMFGAQGVGKFNSTQSIGSLESCIPMTASYPIVRLPSNADDGNYLPVGWEPRATTTALGRFLDVSNWLSSRISVAQFAGVPLGNVSSTDVHSQALDVLVGRELCNRDHVLWASNSTRPDLGGLEEDDANLDHEIPTVPEISVPGSYRTICVDTELSNLAIATILSSSHVNQLEGTDLAFDAAANAALQKAPNSSARGGFGEEGTIGGKYAAPLDEMASSAPAFRVLKDLVASWDKAASNSSNPEASNTARSLLDNLLRWTRSENAILYEPAVAKFLGWLIKKMFGQLVSELRNLGATIVFASLSRIILATPKTETLDGLRYAGFLETTLRTKPLFRHIHFQPLIGVYSSLLFVDRLNFGALPSTEEEQILSGEFDQASSKNVANNRTVASRDIPYPRMTWDIARYLPIPVAVLWTQIVEEFIRRPMVARLRAIEKEDMPSEIENDQTLAQPVERGTAKRRRRPRGDGFAEEVSCFMRGLSGQLLEKIHEIREKTPTLIFPNVPSVLEYKNNRRNPALEFVRTLCFVLSLDGAASEDVAGMRRSLLRLLGVREFAKESQFIDPALPVLLRDVICTYCNAVVDLDVARDARLWTAKNVGDEDDGSPESNSCWACEYCGNHYDMRQIELDLLRSAQRVYTAYQVQDLVCKKCNMVKRENMTTHCSCSGARFDLSLSQETLQKQLYALKSVAQFHKFEFLLETVSWMVDCTDTVHV